jgi:hypothetical protein
MIEMNGSTLLRRAVLRGSFPWGVALVCIACGGGGGGGTDQGTVADVPAKTDVADVPAVDPGPNDPGTLPDLAKPDVPVIDPGTTTDPGQTTTVKCPATPVTGPSCAEMAACILSCDGDNAHETACTAQGDPKVADALGALQTCLTDSKCDRMYEGFNECANKACADPIAACFAGTGKCNDIRKCRIDCDAEDTACALRCLALGDKEAQGFWVQYVTCIFGTDCTNTDLMPNGWPETKCEQYAQGHHCPNQTQACIPPQ